ncbi:MAG: type I restriction enzyme HsdR N-terminal domain-containing protein [Flavobacteriaceae bacterium]|nr:type I restriction enzyme HsdR N-terminal domain-containing protein [Flavobacteriaceae bacterium]
MYQLNFPNYEFRFKNRENKTAIFSVLRKKFLILTPEEWVRQHCVHFLSKEKAYPLSLLSEERKIVINGITKRYDIVAFEASGEMNLIVECKSPSVKITQTTFDQIARYNMQLDAKYLMITNGLNHYFCSMNQVEKKYDFLSELPNFK